MSFLSAAGVLDVWEAGLAMTPAARALLLLRAMTGDDLADAPVGQRDLALLRAYSMLSPALTAVTNCPACAVTLEVTVSPRQLAARADMPETVSVDTGGCHVVARLPTGRDLAELPHGAPLAELRDILFDRCVLQATAHGEPLPARALPAAVQRAVEEALENADPAASLRVVLTCDACEHEWPESVDPVRLAWSAVTTSAQRLATDVHTLAHAYGWSEHDILALSPFRRELYLTAVQS